MHSEALLSPVNVTWEVTARCNLACRHCLSSDLRGAGTVDLTDEQCLAVVDELARIQVFQVNFGGGEPFLRPGLVSLLRYAQSRGIVTCVSTNGTLVTRELARELASMPLLYLQVSLDGATAATNDTIRGAGTYERILAGVELLAESGVRGLGLNLVVTSLNFHELDDFGALADSYGARTRLSRFRPAGRAREVWEEYRLAPAQLAELSDFLGRRRQVLTGDSFFPLTPESRAELGLNMCGAAKMTCAIAPNGDVYPCAFLGERSFRAGSVLEERLGDLWASSEIFGRLRELEVDACRGCERLGLCHGGCPAVAYFTTASLGLPDPECLQAARSPQGVC